ncbi:hypothetical protein CQ018_11160 [Arthrobacter sp. MYb227]|uniref:phosphotransferase family protein n=1 Tax=Arthrobacter sp. MYb227 TaxID=1848601 RepID=UPI000CFA8E95|nr:phosphotransferase [Arthrobacter sp. MYb227]PQZ93007.1 hypothetical protein CQ018_11160 [Arthrobacter sp. MYb227]
MFTRPAHLHEIDLAESMYPGPSWKTARVNEGGQFHVVLVAPGEAVLRMSRTPEAADQLQRRVDLIAALEPQLTFQLPTALTTVLRQEGFAAVVQRFIPGSAHPPLTGDPHRLRALVTELAQVDVHALSGFLAQPFAYGGVWSDERIDSLLQMLPIDLIPPAKTVLARIASFDSITPSLVHGDLTGHNLHWQDSNLVGVLDWDLAAAWDPALNSAYLGLWHGEEMIEQIAATPQEAWRARIWLGTMSLESIYQVGLGENPQGLAVMVEKVSVRLHRAASAARL